MVTDVNTSKIKPKVAMRAFYDARIDANNFYLIIPTPNDRAHNTPTKHMIVYTISLFLFTLLSRPSVAFMRFLLYSYCPIVR